MALGASALTATAADAAPAAKAKATISITSAKPATGHKVIKGGKLVLRGTTSKNLRSSTLAVQIFRSNRWQSIGISTRVSSTSTFSVAIPVSSSAGKVHYALYYGGSKKTAATRGARTVSVWQWYSLAGQNIVKSDYSGGCCGFNPYAQTDVYVAGKRYGTALESGANFSAGMSGWAEFNLGYHCSDFSTLVGEVDSSDTGSQTQFVVAADGVTQASATLGLGQAQKLAFPLSGYFRLRLTNTGVVQDAYANAAWPGARILCSTNPGPTSN